MPKANILILGATSAMAIESARLWAARGSHLHLVARNAARLKALAADLTARGATVTTHAQDLASTDVAKIFPKLLKDITGKSHGDLTHALLAYAILPDETVTKTDLASAAEVLQTNLASATQWSLALAEAFAHQKHGTLLLISSVAGDRGRQGNIVYNASKAGLSVLGEGLAHYLAPTGARCVIIKPGTTISPMTAHMPGRKGPLWATAQSVAKVIVKAGDNGHSPFSSSVYAPWFWRYIMLIIRFVPAALLHKTKL